MQYREKIFLLIISSVSLCVGGALYWLTIESEAYLLENISYKAMSIASTGATLIDGELLAKLNQRDDENKPEYQALTNTLRRIRNANRRDDTWVEYTYLLRKNSNDPHILEFVADAEEGLANQSHLGDVYHAPAGRVVSFVATTADEYFTKDQWGEWLSASAPIRDRSGKTVAALAIDFPKSVVAAKKSRLALLSTISMVAAAIFAFLAAWLARYLLAKPVLLLRDAVRQVQEGKFDLQIPIKGHDEIATLARSIESMSRGLKERETVKGAFSRYVSNQVLDTIIKSGELPTVAGVRRRITVLFSDIRGFTTLAEKLGPDEIVSMLNDYFDRMVSIIFKNGGTLDKFIGDGIMVVFGAPHEDPEQEEHAVRTAVEMRAEVQKLHEKWALRGVDFKIGIGVHSGTAIVGNIGSSQRMEYTAIGDTVNIASRLESATKEIGVDILISEQTYSAVRNYFPFSTSGAIKIRGRSESVGAYTVNS